MATANGVTRLTAVLIVPWQPQLLDVTRWRKHVLAMAILFGTPKGHEIGDKKNKP